MICYLVRHGKDDDTLRGGWSQQPLTDEGNAQAKELASFVQRSDLRIKHIYSSDLPRAVQTAQPVADQLHLPIMQMPEFREVNNGDLAGMKNELANRIYPGLYWNTLDWEEPYPGGESPRAFYERICTAWDAFQKMILKQNENVLLVTHDLVGLQVCSQHLHRQGQGLCPLNAPNHVKSLHLHFFHEIPGRIAVIIDPCRKQIIF